MKARLIGAAAYAVVAVFITSGIPMGGRAGAEQPLPSLVFDGPDIPATAHEDRTVTFAIRAPVASEVDVFLPNRTPNRYPMTKGANGTWTVTTGPLEPQLLNYSFLIGGARVNSGVVTVPGPGMALYERQSVPHGSVTHLLYEGKVQGRTRPLNIYLPPQYDSQPRRRFPVVLLFNGSDEMAWQKEGRLSTVMDNLIASGKAEPMIVVMPDNTTGPRPRPALENAAIMEREIMGEILPMVDRRFRTLPGRLNRAIAGVSFGGGTAFTVGMRHLDTFAWIGEFGTGTFGGADSNPYAPGYVPYNPDNITPNMYAKLTAPATKPRLFWMSVGDADQRAPSQKKAYALFRENGVEPLFRTYPGAHEWKVFGPSFADMAPLLFK